MMTPEEARELGLPGTYMTGDDGSLTYFPAPVCIRCIGQPEDQGKHDGCVWQYWGSAPWIPEL